MYSPIGDIYMLLEMKRHGWLPNYLLLLAHNVVQFPKEYEKLLEGWRGTLMLDNSLIELGKPADPEVMLAACDIAKPNYMALPDKLSDAAATLTAVKNAIEQWAWRAPINTGYMYIPQGSSYQELGDCAVQMQGINPSRAKMFGLPRVVTNKLGSRHHALSRLDKLGWPIHLLGMSDNFIDDISCFRYPNVTGIDSATPMRCGYEQIRYYDRGAMRLPEVDREVYMVTCHEFNHCMAYNMGFIQGQIQMVKRG